MIEFLPFSRPSFDAEEEAEVLSVLRSGWITTGPRVKQFEQDLARHLDVPDVVALSSCTAALHLAYVLAGLGPGCEVLVPSLTFASTVHMVLLAGATPVFVDVDPETLTISPRDAESRITPRTRALVAVDYAGTPADYDALGRVCKAHDLVLIADAAHSFGAESHGRKVGTLADFTCFSFYANKNLTTAEGGALVASDPGALSRARVLSLHGMDKDAWKRYDKSGSWRYEISALGFKYNMTDIQAALGIHQLKKLPAFNARRRAIVEAYRAGLAGVRGIRMLGWPQHCTVSAHLAVLLVEPDAKLDRDRLIEALKDASIGTSVHFIPVHIQPLYRRAGRTNLPTTEAVFQRILSLPLFPAMTDSDVRRVVETIRDLEG